MEMVQNEHTCNGSAFVADNISVQERRKSRIGNLSNLPPSNNLVLVSVLLILACAILPSRAWVSPSTSPFHRIHRVSPSNFLFYAVADVVDFDSLMDMDVVVYSLKPKEDEDCGDAAAAAAASKTKYLGAIQEDGTLAPLSVWSMDPAFGNSLEFLVDEADRFPGLRADQVVIHRVIGQSDLSYGSRQVGGGKGLGNPHGEESELLYYVDKNVVEGIEIPVKPELEILW